MIAARAALAELGQRVWAGGGSEGEFLGPSKEKETMTAGRGWRETMG